MKEEFNYASYTSRLGAMLIDVLVFQFLMLLIKYWGGVGKWYYIIYSVTNIFWIYFITIYLVKRTGASLGKLILGLVIVKTDGQPVGWKNAILRESIALVKIALQLIIILSVFNKIDNSYYLSLKPNTTQEYLHSFSPYFSYLYWVGIILTAVNAVLIFTNKRKRLLHDFIAGTVVITREKT